MIFIISLYFKAYLNLIIENTLTTVEDNDIENQVHLKQKNLQFSL